VLRAQCFGLSAWVIPANSTQDGPARIVTISHTSPKQNISLGQGLWGNQPSDIYDVRLMTTEAPNSHRAPMTTPEGSLTT